MAWTRDTVLGARIDLERVPHRLSGYPIQIKRLMKPAQIFICAILMAAPVLYVAMPQFASSVTEIGAPLSEYVSPFAKPANGWERKAALETPRAMSRIATATNQIPNWPPVDGKPFPEIELFDHLGLPFDFRGLGGKPTVIEFISMTCAGCQALAGGNKFGPYGDLAVQPNLESFDVYFRQHAGFDLHSGDVNYVVAVVYNDKLQNPTAEDLNRWRNHFQLDHQNTHIVGGPKLASAATFRMIPGFMLLDEDLVVLFDSTGHQPKHDLYRELLPALSKMARSWAKR